VKLEPRFVTAPATTALMQMQENFMQSYRNWLIGLVLLGFTSACSYTAKPPKSVDQLLSEKGVMRGETITRIPNRRINGWRAVNDSNLIVTVGVRNEYLVALERPCLGLRGAFSIGFTSRLGGLDQFESIIVQGPGRQLDRCPIAGLTQLDAISVI